MRLKTENNGFTLIELIVVIIIASIFATMMYQFVYTASVRSPEPIFILDKSLKLHEILENITSDYLDYLKNFTSGQVPVLVYLQPKIGTTEGSNQNNDYGAYVVIHNRFIKFVSNSEQTAPAGDPENGNLLKLTIESISSGERLTVLYHKQ